MNNLAQKIKKAPWVIKQPLTKVPSYNKAKISDLFIWRYDNNWQTFFELLDIASLFGDSSKHKVDIIFFNNHGKQIHKQQFKLNANKRNVLDISSILTSIKDIKTMGNFGLFCIFHNKTPDIITKLGSFITERGYISYQYKNAALRSFVHGNFDAISNTNNNINLELLSGNSFLVRKYNLQYLLLPNINYEIAFVNTSSKNKKITINIISLNNQKTIKTKGITIAPRASFIFVSGQITTNCRLVIKSKIIMARPVIFCFNNDKMDVFHG